MSLDRVPGHAELYIGGLFSLRRYEALKKANITHVVSALRLPLDQELFKSFKHHVVDIDDVEDENIIQYFAASNAFITEGLEAGGGVLVHCAMGKSRSVTLAIAYLLSTLPRNESNTPSTILALIRQARPFAEPNPGFMSQLNLYHIMNMPSTLTGLDTHPEYQRWLYQRAVEESNSRGVAPEVGEIHFADSSTTTTTSTATLSPQKTSAAAAATADSSPSSSSPAGRLGTDTDSNGPRDPTSSDPQVVAAGRSDAAQPHAATPTAAVAITSYRCRRCRHQLATSRYVVEHSPSGDDAVTTSPNSTTTTTRNNNNSNSRPASKPPLTTPAPTCAHLFLEPLSWMRHELELGKLSGRLECPNVKKCGYGTSVGRYAWQGLQCSCGAWVVPGVSLARGKVDEVIVTETLAQGAQAEGLGLGRGVRRPPSLGVGMGGKM